jgi:iron complex outermembrane recepter protein
MASQRFDRTRASIRLVALYAGCGIGALALAVPSVSFAAGQESPAASEQDGSFGTDIIVTANKKSEKLSKVGAGIAAISGENLEKLHASTLTDYLSLVPGVSFTSYGRPGQTQVVIRGIAPLGLGSAIATYVDDIPVGSSSNEAQGSSYSPDIDPADLDHVEVLKGPQGTLYGASSLGGVLKYVLKAPNLTRSELATSAEMRQIDGGGFGYKLRVAGSVPLVTDVLALRASGYYRRDPGFIDNPLTGAKNINRGEAYGVRGTLLYAPTSALQIKLGAVYQKSNADGLNAVSYNAAPTQPPPFVATYGDLNQYLRLSQPNRVKDQIFSAEIRYDFGAATLISATGLSREDIYRLSDVTGTYTRPSFRTRLGLPAGANATLVNNYNIKKFSQEVRLQSASNERFEWIVGGIFLKETSHTDGTVNIRDNNFVILPQPAGIASISNTENELTEYAGFANAMLYIVPSVDVSVGYRRSHIKQRNEIRQTGYIFTPANPTNQIYRLDTPVNDVNTYSVGARWRVTSDVLLYARAASGFRAGGGRGQPPLVIPDFKFSYEPDSVWSYETGVKASLGNGLATVDVSAFYIDWSDIQTLVPALPGSPFLIVGNGGKAVSKGIEGQVRISPVRGLSVTAAGGYTDSYFDETVGTVVKGAELQGVSKYTASLQAEYRHDLSNDWSGFVGGDYRYRSSMLDAIDGRMPGYGQFGLNLGAEHRDLRISLFVVNLTDKRGLLGYTGGGNQPGDPYRYAVVTPRTFGASISQKW